MAVPDRCNQYPGFSAVWPSFRPLAIARALMAWSEESAVSGSFYKLKLAIVLFASCNIRITISASAAAFSMTSVSSRAP